MDSTSSVIGSVAGIDLPNADDDNATTLALAYRKHRWVWRWLLLAAVCVVLGLSNLGGYRPLTTHEVLVAQTAREMLANKQWILPSYFGETRLRKPPLAYWLCILTYVLTGEVSEFSARLPSVLSGMLLVAAGTLLTRSWFGRSTAWLTGFVLATSVFFIQQARLAEADITLAAMIAVALAAYGLTVSGKVSPASASIAFWSALGLSVLAKGPVGLAMVAVTVLGHCVLLKIIGRRHSRQQTGRVPSSVSQFAARSLPLLFSGVGLAIFVVLCVSWPLAVVWLEPGAATIWYRETIGRFLEDPNGVQRHPFYYPLAALWLTLPWTGFWLVEMWRWRKSRYWEPKRVLLVCWFVLPMALLSCSSGKQEHYLIPALVPCAIASALTIRRLVSGSRHPRRGTLLASAGGLIVLCILLLQWTVLPRLHGRREAVDWLGQQSQSLTQWAHSSSTPADRVIALGHSVHWLVFYFPAPMQRMDSLEEFLATVDSPQVWVLLPQVVLPQLQPHGHFLEVRQCPSVTGLSDNKRPALVLFQR